MMKVFEVFMNNDESIETIKAEKETNELEQEFLKLIGTKYKDELSDFVTTLESIWIERGFKAGYEKSH